MRMFDRIVLILLALGVWAFVLSPQITDAHHDDASHSCDVSGSAYGEIESLAAGGDVFVYDVSGISVDCSHY